MIQFKIGRWWVSLFNPDCIGHWIWKGWGYDGLWDDYGFGFMLQLERETDWLLQIAGELPAAAGSITKETPDDKL